MQIHIPGTIRGLSVLAAAALHGLVGSAPAHAADVIAGRAAWVQASTAARNSSAKGKPNRKRTKVAPSAPSLGVSSRCMALRAVWPAAPSKVKMTQRKFTENYTVSRSRVGSGVGPGRRYATPFLK